MTTAALLVDYLFAGDLIELRLREAVPELAPEGAVQGVEQFAQAVDRSIGAPTAFVLWEGDAFDAGPDGRALGGAAQIVRQQWTVLLAVRNATQDGNSRNESAGPLLTAVHRALAGWLPAGAVRPLRRVPGRKASYTANVGLYPLSFELQLHL